MTLICRVKIAISIRSSFMKHQRINVTRVSDVNERHRDAMRRCMDDLIGHVFYQRVNIPLQMA